MRVLVFDDMSQCTAEEVERMLPMVNVQRREQALRFRHLLGRFCCLKSWLMLYELLRAEYSSTDEADRLMEAGWRYNDYGKPFWNEEHRAGKEEKLPFFSISHCKEAIAVAIAEEEIGIDIEGIRRVDDALLKRTMTEQELGKIINPRGEIDPREFTRLWTRKEAVLKALGTGITGFENLQQILERFDGHIQTIEKEVYIYSIVYGKLHCFSA